MKNTMTKTFLARAHYRARADGIVCLPGQNLMIIEFLQQCEVWRAPRAQSVHITTDIPPLVYRFSKKQGGGISTEKVVKFAGGSAPQTPRAKTETERRLRRAVILCYTSTGSILV